MGWFIPVASALVGAFSASKQRKQSKKLADRQFEEQQKQQALLEEQKQAYRDITFTNPYADMENAYGGLQTDFSNLAAGAENVYAGAQNVYAGAQNMYAGLTNQYAGLENLYEGMENRFEDATVDMRAADFQAQQGQQQRANIMQGLRGAAGTSGVAGLAQAMAGQGALQSQQIAAGIGQQERQNQMLAMQEGSRIDQLQRGAGMQLQQLQAGGAQQLQAQQAAGAMQQQQMIMGGAAQQQQMQLTGAERLQAQQLQGAERARALGLSRENLVAQGAWQTDIAQRGGEAMLQEAEMSRQATLLGMQYGASSGANQAWQQALLNQNQAGASANQMMIGAISGLGGMDWGGMGFGQGGGGWGGQIIGQREPVQYTYNP